MYENHAELRVPSSTDARVWRYMDFTKFVDLLDRERLFFPHLGVLQDADPYEGAPSQAMIRNMQERYAPDPTPGARAPRPSTRLMAALVQGLGSLFYVSSWHMNDEESAAMWRLYLKSNEGVAIRSTFQRLTEAFPAPAPRISIGMVEYIDYARDAIPSDNMLHPAFRKRRSFEHERELRAVVVLAPAKPPDPGLYVPVRLDTLIDRVYVAPTAPGWLGELVERVIRRYGHTFPVERSTLMDRPMS